MNRNLTWFERISRLSLWNEIHFRKLKKRDVSDSYEDPILFETEDSVLNSESNFNVLLLVLLLLSWIVLFFLITYLARKYLKEQKKSDKSGK